MKMIVGLGNPGKEYVNTRHNIGFSVVDYIAIKKDYEFKNDNKFNASVCKTLIDGEKVVIIKPMSFMNLSGTVVKRYADFFQVEAKDILVIQDDLDMEFGKIRVVYDSSSGGHNGIKNIIQNLGTQEFTRLKIGISKNKDVDTKDYVLGKFSHDELEILDSIYAKLVNIINDFISDDVNNLKQKYNSLSN